MLFCVNVLRVLRGAEVCADVLSRAQQAFRSGREITRNTIKMLAAFARAQEEAGKESTDLAALSLFLLLDCTKGFNHASHEWLHECLIRANTPEPIRLAVDVLLQIEPILRLKGQKFNQQKSKEVLTHGGSASMILFIISCYLIYGWCRCT